MRRVFRILVSAVFVMRSTRLAGAQEPPRVSVLPPPSSQAFREQQSHGAYIRSGAAVIFYC